VEPTNIVGTGYYPKCGEYQPRDQCKVRVQSSPSGFKRKLWKPNKVTKKLLLGSDVGLEETFHMALCGLVGRVSYHYLAQEPLQTWMENLGPFLRLYARGFVSCEGLVGVYLSFSRGHKLLLASRWVFGGSSHHAQEMESCI
jgi:hypothetical protein